MAVNVGTGASVAELQAQATALLNTLAANGAPAPGAPVPGAPVAGGGAPAAGAPAAGAAPAGNATGAAALTDSIPATGQLEKRQYPDGQLKFFGRDGKEITAFQYNDSYTYKINLDYRDGIATGLANLSRVFGARQERVRNLSNALADDANRTGAFNPVDLQKMSLETTTTQQLSEMQKKIFDSMRDSIQAWLR